MSRGERWTIAIGIIGLVGIGLQVWLALLHEEEHRTGIMNATFPFLLGAVVAAVNIWAISRNIRDSNRAHALHAEIVTIKDEHNTQLSGQAKQYEQKSDGLRKAIQALQEQCAEQKRAAEENLKKYNDELSAHKETKTKQGGSSRSSDGTALKDAPKLLVRCPKERNLIVTNDGPNAAVDVQIGPLVHEETHEISVLYAPFGSIASKASEERVITVAQRQPNHGGPLWDAMRAVQMLPQPIDSVTVKFKDSDGTEYNQRFLLTSEVDTSVTWRPEPVTLNDSSHIAFGAH